MAGLDSYVTGLYSFNNDMDDRSGNGLNFTGIEAYSDTTKIFGTHSYYNSWAQAAQTAAASGQNAFGSGDFTIDLWYRGTQHEGSTQVILCTDNISTNYWQIMRIGGGPIEFYARTSSTVTANFKTSGSPLSTHNTWYHIAIVRSGTDEYIFVDGVSQSLTISTGFTGSLGTTSAAPLKLGFDPNDFFGFGGYMDELRISKGIARWTSTFTPPTSEYSEADIAGSLSAEARILIIDESTWLVEHSDIHPAGPYVIPAEGGGGLKTVVALPTTATTAPDVYKNVEPAA